MLIMEREMGEAPPRPNALWHLVCAFRQRRSPAAAVVELAKGLSYYSQMDSDAQQALLDACLHSPAASALPTDADYQRRVLRGAVLAAEQDGQEVCEDLMQLYSRCLLSPPSEGDSDNGSSTHGSDRNGLAVVAVPLPQPGWCYKLYAYAPACEPAADTLRRLAVVEQQAWGPPQRVREQQQRQREGEQPQPQPQQGQASGVAATAGDARHGLLALHVSLNLLEGGTGCHEWEAGFYLAEWVLSHPRIVADQCCLEIGCGAGMVGVALHRCGARRVLLTDGNPEALANCRRNLALNGLPLQGAAARQAAVSNSVPDDSGSSSSASHGKCGGQPDTHAQAELQATVECRQLCWEDGWPCSVSSGGGGDGGSQTAAANSSGNGGGGSGQAGGGENQQPTVVLGADLLYDPTVIPVLLALLKQVLAAAAAAQIDAAGREEEAAAATAADDELAGSRAGRDAAGVAAGQDAAALASKGKQQGEQRGWQQGREPAVYMATTLRNEATLRQFLAAAEADPALRIRQLAPAGGPAPAGAGCGEAAADGSGMGGGGGAWRAAWGPASVCFQHLPELDAARSRIFLHRLTLAPLG